MERRKVWRCNVRAVVSVVGSRLKAAATTQDIGHGGLCFVSTAVFRTGDHLQIVIPRFSAERQFHVVVQADSEKKSQQLSTTRCRYVAHMPKDVLRSLLVFAADEVAA